MFVDCLPFATLSGSTGVYQCFITINVRMNLLKFSLKCIFQFLEEVTSSWDLLMKQAYKVKHIKKVSEWSIQEDGTACKKNGRLKLGWSIWAYETVLTSYGAPASPRANTLSKGWPVGFQTLPFLGCRLVPRSPADKQLTPNPILKALLGFSWYFWFPVWCSESSAHCSSAPCDVLASLGSLMRQLPW